jgi:hypothetical protein
MNNNNNTTRISTNDPSTNGIIHSYLFGESFLNIILRFILILTAIASIWLCMLLLLFVYSRYCHRKQTLVVTHNHQLYQCKTTNLSMKRTNSSFGSVTSRKWQLFQQILPQANVAHTRQTMKERMTYDSPISRSNSAQVHAAIEAMTRPSVSSIHWYGLNREMQSLSHDTQQCSSSRATMDTCSRTRSSTPAAASHVAVSLIE